MSVSMAKTQTALSLATKVDILNSVEKSGKRRSSIAQEFGVSKSTVTRLWSKRAELRAALQSSQFGPERKRFRTAKYCDIEDALLLWFKQAQSLNVTISGPILQAKAQELALSLGHLNFSCSSGWLDRFKSRHSITFRRTYGESTAVAPDMTSQWFSETLPALLAEYGPDDVFAADETGLFWKCLPDKAVSLREETCSDGKLSKERITVMMCASMNGEKLPLLVIGKFKKPKCFENARSLPVTYEANARSWMVSDVFTSWLVDLDNKLQHEGRRVAVVVDQCPAHPNIQIQLKATKLVFLPSNTTSKLQPCGQGIANSLKVQYRKYFLLKLIEAVEAKEAFSPSLLDCLYLLRLAWENVSARTVVDCFRRSGFDTHFDEETSSPSEGVRDHALGNMLLRRLISHGVGVPDGLSFELFASVDEQAITTPVLSNDDIIATVLEKSQTESTEGTDLDDSVPPSAPPTLREAEKALDTLRRFFEAQESSEEMLSSITTVDGAITESAICSFSQSYLSH